MLTYLRRGRKFFAFVALIFALFSITSTATAALVSTTALVQEQHVNQERQQLLAALDREAVQTLLVEQGVDPEAVKLRVASLTDEEVRMLNQKFDEMPAGGIDILGALLLVFIILLITDLVGATDIFPFVKKKN